MQNLLGNLGHGRARSAPVCVANAFLRCQQHLLHDLSERRNGNIDDVRHKIEKKSAPGNHQERLKNLPKNLLHERVVDCVSEAPTESPTRPLPQSLNWNLDDHRTKSTNNAPGESRRPPQQPAPEPVARAGRRHDGAQLYWLLWHDCLHDLVLDFGSDLVLLVLFLLSLLPFLSTAPSRSSPCVKAMSSASLASAPSSLIAERRTFVHCRRLLLPLRRLERPYPLLLSPLHYRDDWREEGSSGARASRTLQPLLRPPSVRQTLQGRGAPRGPLPLWHWWLASGPVGRRTAAHCGVALGRSERYLLVSPRAKWPAGVHNSHKVTPARQHSLRETFGDGGGCVRACVWWLGWVGFWVLGFGLWALGFGLWALGFGLWALGFGLWAFKLWAFRLLGFGLWALAWAGAGGGLRWVGLGCVGLGWAGLGWAGLGWAGLAGLGWAGLGWAGLGWVGLGWVGLGWVGCSWVWLGLGVGVCLGLGVGWGGVGWGGVGWGGVGWGGVGWRRKREGKRL